MIKSYFIIAWRNLLNNKLFSFLNIFGLALSMSAGLIILLIYEDGHNYDKFHADADQIYRVNTVVTRKDGSIEPYATSPKPLHDQIIPIFDWIDKSTTLTILNDAIKKDNVQIQFQAKQTDQNFFNIFNFTLQSGDKNSALTEPNSIVLSPELSLKFFKNENPVNQFLQIGDRGLYKVTGVLNVHPGKTHFEFDALLSSSSNDLTNTDWANYQNTYTYIKTKPQITKAQGIAAINDQSKPFYQHLNLGPRDAHYKLDLQALPEITPGYSIANAMGKGLPKHLIWFLALMGFIMMASAIFNYTNLTLAKSLGRAKEIGVRKAFGAKRLQIFLQIIIEGIVISLISFVIAYFLMMYFKSKLVSFQSFNFFDLSLQLTPYSIVYFFLFTLFTALVAGLLPAITISKLDPLLAFKKIENIKIFKRIGLTKSLLVLQFAFTMLFLMIVTTLKKQVEFAIKMDYGFSTSQIYNLQLQGVSPQLAMAEFSKITGVEKISAIDMPIGTYSNAYINVKQNRGNEYKEVSSFSVDSNMISNLGLKLVTGNNFITNSNTSEAPTQIIVNEAFIENFHLGDAASAVGKTIYMNDTTTASIIGVLKDFLFKPVDYALEPLVLKNVSKEWNMLNIKISPGSTEQTVSEIKSTWQKLAAGYEFKGEFYDATIQNNYLIFNDINKFIQFFALLGLVIGLMGLLGMTIYSVKKRQKEVSIRKVLGANEADIVLTLSKSFIVLVGIGFAIAIPLGLLLCGQILNNFANRISLGLNVVLPGFLLLSVFAILTVTSQTVRTALMNPVKNLRSE